MTITDEPISQPPQRSMTRIVLAVVAIVIVALGVVLLVHHYTKPSVPPAPSTVGVVPGADHTRPATDREARNADRVVGYNQLTSDQRAPIPYPVFVATGQIHTTFTEKPQIIVMAPGTLWLGGPLGQTILVMPRDTGHDFRHAAKGQEYTWYYNFAETVYDPMCRAYSLGLATREACLASPAERHAVTAAEQTLRPFSADELKKLEATGDIRVVEGQYVGNDWTTLAGQTSKLVATPLSTVRDGSSILFNTVLQPGQQLTGGELGTRRIIGPGVTKIYNNAEGSNTGHVHTLIVDPIAQDCNGSIRQYLGPDVLSQYSAYCKAV